MRFTFLTLALATLVAVGLAADRVHATTITFDSTTPTSIVDQGGFTGSSSPALAFTDAEVRIIASGLDPVPTSVTISDIFLKGDGITGSLSLGSLTFTTNSTLTTSPVSLTTPASSVAFANSLVSFNLPGGVINEGAQFQVIVRYSNDDNTNSSSAVTFEAVPEPTTIGMGVAALGGLSVMAFARFRSRRRAAG